MSFFYDLNKKLDSIRATPEVTHKQLNERSMSRAAKGYEKYGKPGMNALRDGGLRGDSEKEMDAIRAKYNKYDESVNESVAAGYDPEMQARIKTATPQQLAQMAQELAGGAGPQYNSELKMLQQAQSELSGQMGEGRHSQDAMKLNPDFDKLGRKPGIMDRVARGAKKVADVLAPGDKELLDRLEKSSGAAPRQPGAKEPRYMEAMSPAKQKSFAALAPPKDKITFADKIAGAKKEVDEMLGDVAAEAMKKALGGGRSRGQGMEEASDDNAFTAHKRPRTDTPKVGTITHGSKHDVEEIPGGRRVTRRTDAQGISVGADDDKPADGEKRSRGRPKGPAKAPERVTGGATKHKGGRKMTKEGGGMMKHTFAILDDTLIDQIANMNGAEVDPDAGSVATYDENTARQLIAFAQKNPQRLKRTQTMNTAGMKPMAQRVGGTASGPEYDLKEEGADVKAAMKLLKKAGYTVEKAAEQVDEKAVSKKQQRFMGMVHAAQKGEKPASGAVAKTAKAMDKKDVKDFAATKHKGLPEKKKPEAKDKKKEVEETSDNTPSKSSGGFKFGGGIYDSINRDLELMIAESMSRLDESMSINMSMNNDEHGGPTRSLTITATDDDAMKLSQLLKSAGLGGAYDAQGTCSVCGGTNCGCNTMDENYGVNEVSQNTPDYPTNTETAQDNFEYSGGLNKPKSTGQTTIPVIASQEERQYTQEGSDYDELTDKIQWLMGAPNYLKPDEAREAAAYTPDTDSIWDGYRDDTNEDAIKRMMEMAGMSAAGGASAGDYIDYVSASGEQPPEDLIMQNGVEYDPDTNVISVRNATSLANTHRAITAAGWKKQAAGARPNPAAAGQAMQAGDTAYQLGEQDAIDRMMEMAGVKKKAVDEEGNLFTKGLADDNVKVGDKIPGTNAVKKKDIDESIFAMTANLWKTYKG